MKQLISIAVLQVVCFTLLTPVAGQDLTDSETKFFESKIRPVLVRECYGCHSKQSGAVKGGLIVDSREGLLRGGDTGPAIEPEDLDESLLWSAINHEDYNMPPGKMLSDAILEDFKKWIEMGAPDPRVVEAVKINSTITEEDVAKAKKEFWAYLAPTESEIPSVEKSHWPITDIDRFVLAKLEENNLRPSSDADLNTLLRRLCFDLTGLPPTPDQIDWLKKNYKKDSEKAIAHIVDSLLTKTEFGERWGRHWLDLARYAESSGREVNLTFPNAWRYRDYVIDSFNSDKPYDRFVQEQIAGDLLPVDTDEQWAENITATGFLALGPKTLTEQNGRQFRLDVVDEQIDVTTRVIMGVSVACARCHDHKFDPIPQMDYYAMAGIFENTSTHYGTIDTQQNRRPSNLLISPVEDALQPDKKLSATALKRLKDSLAEKRTELRELQKIRIQNRRNPDSANNLSRQAVQGFARVSSQVGILEAKVNAYDDNGNPLTYLMGVQSVDRPGNARLLVRGEFDQPAQEVDRGFPEVLCSTEPSIESDSSGRLELARWMGSDENPLTARVMVNRIWQHMMGNALVRTPENFGATGLAPTHPELLDYLAIKFVEDGWSIKKLIREIAISRIYRTASDFDSKSFEADPENQFLWRFEPRRLDAEALRDSILAISGELDLKRPYGSIVSSAGPASVRDGNILGVNGLDTGAMTVNSTARNQRRVLSVEQSVNYRSVYLPIVRDNLPRALDVFDFAESSMVVGKRESSNTPDQGLFFLNNRFVISQCDALALRLIKESNDLEGQVRLAFVLAYGRDATRKELDAAAKFYNEFPVSSDSLRREHEKRLSVLCQGILASAEFRFLD